MTLSIITICYENPSELNLTLDSIKLHTKDISGIEVVVIDGSKSTSCQLIAEKYSSMITTYIRENDNGIYDAMNKGLVYSTGDSVLFMNSGDSFHGEFNLHEFLTRNKDYLNNKIVFGDAMIVIDELNKPIRMKNFINEEQPWWNKKLPCHQATFVPRTFFSSNQFDITLNISADSKLLIDAFNNIEYVYDPVLVCEFELGGVSNNPKKINHVINHYSEIVKTRNINKVREKIILGLSLLRRFILIKMFGYKRYYKFTMRYK